MYWQVVVALDSENRFTHLVKGLNFSPCFLTKLDHIYLNFRFLVKTVCVSILCTCHGLSVHVTVCRYMSHFLGRLFLFVCDILSGRECCTSIVHPSDKVTDFYILAR